MDTLDCRAVIERVLTQYGEYPCAASGLDARVLFDHEHDQYALV